MNADMTKQDTIQAGPRNWKETLPLLTMLIQHGNPTGRDYAMHELDRMAQLADMYVEHVKQEVTP